MDEVNYSNTYFYKYRPINPNTENLLKRNELYFSRPDGLNDPFDCKTDYYSKNTREEWAKVYCERGRHPVEARNIIKENLKKGFFKQKKDGILWEGEKLDENDTFLRACSFSERKDSLLMWGHYAKHHEGICFCFKSIPLGDHYVLPLASEHTLPFHKVKYNDDKPKAIDIFDKSYPKQSGRIVEDFFLTKYTDWQYEKEYRLLATIYELEEKGTINFQKDALQGVIFGLKINPDDAQSIKDIVDEYYKGIDVKLYRTEKVKGKYAIKVIEIKNFGKYIKLLEQNKCEAIDYDSDKAFIDYIEKYATKHPQNKLAKQILSELTQDHLMESD